MKKVTRDLEVAISTLRIFKNRLLKRRSILFLGVPTYGNIGDIAIALATESMIRKSTKKHELIVINDSVSVTAAKFLRHFVSPNDCIVFQGGGNMGNMYKTIETERESVFLYFKNLKLLKIQFPSSINFENVSDTNSARLASIFTDVEIFARETISFDSAKKLNLGTVHLSPDIVFSLADSALISGSGENKRRKRSLKKVLVIRRNDEEKLENTAFDKLINAVRNDASLTINYTDTVIDVPSLSIRTDRKREKLLEREISEIKNADVVLTDRLHGMILSLISGIPVVAFDNSTHKIRSTCQHWLSGNQNLFFCNSVKTINLSQLKTWYSGTDGYPPNLNDYFDDLRNLISDGNEAHETK